MKKLAGVLLLAALETFAAAPESIGGKVFRDYRHLSGVTNASEGALIFGNDGRYFVLKAAFGVVARPGPPNVLPEVLWGAIHDPGPSGRFSYEKSGETTDSYLTTAALVAA